MMEKLVVNVLNLKHQPHKMVKHTQIIRRQQQTNCLSVFDHFWRLGLKGLPQSHMKSIPFIKIKNAAWSFNFN